MRPESVDPLVKEAMNAPEAPLPLAIVDAASPASALEREPAGWLDISPGPNLEGWTDYPWPPGTPRERMRRRLWSMDQGSGTLRAARGDQTTILVTDEMYRDFVLHVEYRYPRGELGIANSGVQVRMIPGERVMHQFELYESIGFLMGGVVEAGVLTELKAVRPGYGEWELAPIHTPRGWNQFVTSRDAGPDPKAPAAFGSPRPVIRRPRGEWNIVEVTAVGGRIVVWMNGGVASYTDQVRVARGAVALEAEHFPIEFRNIRIKLLP